MRQLTADTKVALLQQWRLLGHQQQRMTKADLLDCARLPVSLSPNEAQTWRCWKHAITSSTAPQEKFERMYTWITGLPYSSASPAVFFVRFSPAGSRLSAKTCSPSLHLPEVESVEAATAALQYWIELESAGALQSFTMI